MDQEKSHNKFDAEMDRGKGHLTRSQFQDVPLMSLVPEEKQSTNYRSYTLRSPILYSRKPPRPVSPLPPLVMEKELNRHDEPEEFYVKLERKVLKIYRRLFIERKSDILSNIETDHTADVSTNSEKRPSTANNDDEVRKPKRFKQF